MVYFTASEDEPPLVPYQHLPLRRPRDFRLLVVSQDGEDSLRFFISHHRLDDPPLYEAVSYSWGGQTRDRPILEWESETFISVTANCEAALQKICSHHPSGFDPDGKPHYLWVDVVCIDLENMAERARQASLMNVIFGQAYETNVYLGEPDEDSDIVLEGIKLCKSMANEIQHGSRGQGTNSSDSDPARRSEGRTSEQEMHPTDSSPEQFAARNRQQFTAFFSRPWFSRTWTLPEALLSSRVYLYLGDDIIHLEDIQELWRTVEDDIEFSTNETPSTDSGNLFDLLSFYYAERTRVRDEETAPHQTLLATPQPNPTTGFLAYGQLFDLLYRTCSLQCSDPRDKVIALLSLFTEATPPLLAPDYTAPVAQTYANASRFLIQRGATVALSAASGIAGDPTLPTWAIDWQSPPARKSLLNDSKGTEQGWSAGVLNGKKEVTMYASSDSMTLVLRGRRISSVICIRSPDDPVVASSSKSAVVIDDDDDPPSPASSSSSPDGEPMFEYDSDDDVEAIGTGRVGFVLENGSYGMGTWQTRVGDVVVLLLGFEVPFLMRGHHSSADGRDPHSVQLVGECVVEGLMGGEGLGPFSDGDVDAGAETPPEGFEDFHIV